MTTLLEKAEAKLLEKIAKKGNRLVKKNLEVDLAFEGIKITVPEEIRRALGDKCRLIAHMIDHWDEFSQFFPRDRRFLELLAQFQDLTRKVRI